MVSSFYLADSSYFVGSVYLADSTYLADFSDSLIIMCSNFDFVVPIEFLFTDFTNFHIKSSKNYQKSDFINCYPFHFMPY